jgi:hypothetical protein
MQAVFAELKKKANPRLLLKPADTVEDLGAETNKLLSGK